MTTQTQTISAPQGALTGRRSMSPFTISRRTTVTLSGVVALAALSACSPATDHARASDTAAARVTGTAVALRDTTITGALELAGVAEPLRQATLSTKLMGTVTRVLVQEGDVVRSGQVLLSIDARELTAKSTQVAASIESATAMQVEASTQAARIRALYADSAATRAQFDAATAGLARADAGLRAARAAAAELDAVSSYASVRAPFAGVVTARLADPGSFAAPGAPLLTVQDVTTLRVSVSAPGDAVRDLRRGQTITGSIDGVPVSARIEGVVPAGAGNLFTVNATVINGGTRYRAGSAATLALPGAERTVVMVPVSAIIREGDLTGVTVRGAARDELRWVRLGATHGSQVEVAGGLQAGETVVVRSAVRPGA
jgi:RND family efflux transporter MFP subunit